MQVNANKEVKKVKLNHDSFTKTMVLFFKFWFNKNSFLQETDIATIYRLWYNLFVFFIEDKMSKKIITDKKKPTPDLGSV